MCLALLDLVHLCEVVQASSSVAAQSPPSEHVKETNVGEILVADDSLNQPFENAYLDLGERIAYLFQSVRDSQRFVSSSISVAQ